MGRTLNYIFQVDLQDSKEEDKIVFRQTLELGWVGIKFGFYTRSLGETIGQKYVFSSNDVEFYFSKIFKNKPSSVRSILQGGGVFS